MNTKKNSYIKKYEENKQGKEYLSYIYSENRRPITDYPNKLAIEIIKRNNIRKNSELLDVGCGRGDMLKAFKENGLNVQGVDLSEESSRILFPIKIHQRNLENETLEDKKDFFDIIFSKSLIEHLNSPLSFLKNCKKLLKKDGVYLIMTERGNIEDLMKKIGIVRKDKKKSKGSSKKSKESLKKLSKKSSKQSLKKSSKTKRLSKKSLKTNSKLGRPRKNK